MVTQLNSTDEKLAGTRVFNGITWVGQLVGRVEFLVRVNGCLKLDPEGCPLHHVSIEDGSSACADNNSSRLERIVQGCDVSYQL